MRVRNWLLTMVVICLFLSSISVSVVEAQETKWLDSSQLQQGIVTITYPIKKDVVTKVIIIKGIERYTYRLYKNKENFPLQMGNGKYKIYVLEHLKGNSYKKVASAEVSLNLKSSQAVYLNAIQNINWSDKSAAIVKANELVKNLKTDEDKLSAIYEFVYKTIKYDNKLAATVNSDYLPNIDYTLKMRKDICYGYASLFAAMLRSQQIPTKLVMGESSYVKEYHSWNEVYLNGKWIVIDTTLDAGLYRNQQSFSMIKDNKKYKASKVY